jgi:phage terminase large subunit-like protein
VSVVEAPVWAGYATGSRIDHFAWWTEAHCRHAVGPFAGQPLVFEPFQLAFFGEALAIDEDELPYWRTVVMIVPRKNGKTTGTSPIAAYNADERDEKPIIGLAATSDEQASELFDAIAAFIAASPYLSERFHIRDYDGEIARTDDGGFIRRQKMDWRRLHGKNLDKLIADEIHAWSTPNLRGAGRPSRPVTARAPSSRSTASPPRASRTRTARASCRCWSPTTSGTATSSSGRA